MTVTELKLGTGGRPRVLVAGAGPAGLFAAKTLAESGASVVLIDQADHTGGLAAGEGAGGNHFECGVHHLHAFDEMIFDELRRLLGDRLRPVQKSALIRWGRGFCSYPLRFADLVRALGPVTLARCCTGLALQQMRNRVRPSTPRNGEEALVQLYGRPLYEVFFADFTHRYWGVPPRDLSAEFIRKKMPRLSAIDPLRKLLARFGLGDRGRLATESATRAETLWYTANGARGLCEALEAEVRRLGVDVRLSTPLEAIRLTGHEVSSVRVGGREERVDFVISTVPLPALVRSLEPAAPGNIRRAAASLRYKPVTALGLRVARERVLDALYVYYRDRPFHRLSEPKQSGLQVTPAHHSIIVAELTAPVPAGDAAAEHRVVGQVVEALEADGLLTKDEVVQHHFVRESHGYPVYMRDFEPRLEDVRRYLGGLEGLLSTGRQGDFAYPNMHQAMRMGHEAALRAMIRCAAPAGSAAPEVTSTARAR